MLKRHRLLERQLKKFQIPEESIEQYKGFFNAVDAAYHSSTYDLKHLEQMLELSSNELFKANQKLKEENVQKSEEVIKTRNQLNHVMANVHDIMLELDAAGNFTYLNPAWINYGEEPREESIGKNFMEFSNNIEFFDKDDLRAIVNREFEDDHFVTVFSRYNKSGELKWWEISGKILRDESNAILGAVSSLKDVTTLKNAERDLIVANETKDRFLSTMSHEIRTPLNAVIAISNILSIQDPKPSQIENIEVLKYSSKNLLNLINDILDYNKLSTGKLNFESSQFNLKKNCEQLIKSYSFLVHEKPVTLNLEMDPNIHTVVNGDSTRLTQVLGNLLNNAIKFTLKGSVVVQVEQLNENKANQTLRFKIKDTGIGIPEDKLEYIFERFTQAEADTTKKFGGTGLGLAICKKILNLQGSDINVKSTLHEGTTFWFDLIFDKVNEKDLLQINEEVDMQFNLEGLNLLIVDDNPINVMVATQFFEKWNIKYKEAGSSAEAISVFNKNDNFDLILMDLQMPDKSGYETAEQIRSMDHKNSDIPIVALSASSSDDVKEKVLAAGMDDYMCKPFDPVDLYHKLKQYYKAKTVSSPRVKQ